ncbi:TPA: hypothetical protein ACIVT4_003320, partial [Salmonella enterica subsp. diarizonae serovar 61:l,v:z35]
MTRSRFRSDSIDGFTFIISPHGQGCRLSVEPEYRRNGTQSYDGWFPRFYTKPQYAKAALTRFLGEPVNWLEYINHNYISQAVSKQK